MKQNIRKLEVENKRLREALEKKPILSFYAEKTISPYELYAVIENAFLYSKHIKITVEKVKAQSAQDCRQGEDST